MDGDVLFGLLLLWFICGLIGGAIGRDRGRNDGFVFGFLLGPLGLLILYLGPNPKRDKDERENRLREQRRAEERHQRQLSEMRAMIDSLSANQSADSPKAIPVIQAREGDWYWVKHFEKDKEHGPISRPDMLDLFAARKIKLDTLVARDRSESPKEFRTLGEEIPALRMLSSSVPPPST
jgi:hypothetical protein